MTFLRLATISGIGLALVLPSEPAFATPSLDKVSADWWQWALAVPNDHNPLLDTTGADCAVNQSGPFWFLGGLFSGGAVDRSCAIPKNQRLFFPIANQINFNTPNVCGQGPDDLLVSDMRAASATFVAGLTNVSVQLDGQPLSPEDIVSIVFSVKLPEQNLFDPICQSFNLGNVPAGKYRPAVDEGLYVALDPLSHGQHTLHFHAENPSQGFFQDVTYHLTVR